MLQVTPQMRILVAIEPAGQVSALAAGGVPRPPKPPAEAAQGSADGPKEAPDGPKEAPCESRRAETAGYIGRTGLIAELLWIDR